MHVLSFFFLMIFLKRFSSHPIHFTLPRTESTVLQLNQPKPLVLKLEPWLTDETGSPQYSAPNELKDKQAYY